MALCHSLASYGATLPSFLVSTRNQSKSDSPRAFLSPLLAAPSQLLIAFQRSTMLVLLCAALSPFAKLSPLTPSRTISSSDRPFYPRSGNSTRLQLFRTMARQQGASGTAESSGWRQVCIFTRRPPTPIRACITAVLSTRRRVRVLFTASFVHPCNSCTTIYTKSIFHLFHATDVASPRARNRLANVGHLTIGQDSRRVLPVGQKFPLRVSKRRRNGGKNSRRK